MNKPSHPSIKRSLAVLLIVAIFTSVGGLVFSAATNPSQHPLEFAIAEKSDKSEKETSTNSAAGEEKKSKKKKSKGSSSETNKAAEPKAAAPASSNR